MRIDRVEAVSITDTRGRATIETTVFANTFSATASVPSGKSTGKHEACELRDSDGSVTGAVANINGEIARALVGRRFQSLDALDTFLIDLDGTPEKSRLGANALLSVSIAAMRLSALLENTPLWSTIAKRAKTTPGTPRLYVNVMNGGAHADFKLPFQEYILVVEGKTALPIAQEMFVKLGERLGRVPMGDEGGYAPTFDTLERPFELLSELVKEFPNTGIALDAAASELFHDDTYHLLGKPYTPEELSKLYEQLIAQFPIHSIEDPYDESAHLDFARLTEKVGGKVLIVGDDLTVTNPVRIKDAARNREINSVLIKPNQIGTVSEALQAVQETLTAEFKAIASHRSGETKDTFIADFAYGIGAYGLKAGGFAQEERILKYNRLVAIEGEAGTV
ncbi:phosphopyruvate hydratase [Candidatus Parcubacteria bacterium]|nr:phosphopyruvate hydratase [Candidatus Parcubacteria bacterium]